MLVALYLFIASTTAQIQKGNYNPILLTDYIAAEATLAGVNPQLALSIAKNESGLNPEVFGDKGTSVGLFQIHLPAHRDISKDQALDPVFSTQWSINQLKKGNCHIWSTCPL